MGDIIYDAVLQKTKQIREMQAAKLILSLLGWFGIAPLYIYAWVINLDNIKGTILFIFALIMASWRFYYWRIRAIKNNELKDIEIQERRNEVEEKRVELIERELRARITGIPKK